jgi:N-acetylglucosaminyldiphosphoundecaprenol N-acetyl-beta-D-mannosaminyltransferase
MSEAVATLEEFIQYGGPHHVAVINANKLWLMEKDARIKRILQEAALVVPEKTVVIGGRILGTDVLHHVGGIMLLKAFLPRAQEKGYRLFFLGAKPEIVKQMVETLTRTYPGLQIAGWEHGYWRDSEAGEVEQKILQAKPDIVFVAMGTPKQELWITEHLPRIGVPVCMGVGGSFDVIAGLKKDAPPWVRAIAMEWLYRLMQDPRNLWKRYLITIPWFLRRVLGERFKKSFARLDYGRS